MEILGEWAFWVSVYVGGFAIHLVVFPLAENRISAVSRKTPYHSDRMIILLMIIFWPFAWVVGLWGEKSKLAFTLHYFGICLDLDRSKRWFANR